MQSSQGNAPNWKKGTTIRLPSFWYYIFLYCDKAFFFHFAGNSLRLVHVFWRLPEKTSHPFFDQKWVFWPFSAKKGQKRPKGREEKKFSLPRKEESTKKTGKKKNFPFPGKEKNFPFPGKEKIFPFPGRENFFSSRPFVLKRMFWPFWPFFLAFFGLCSPWNIH